MLKLHSEWTIQWIHYYNLNMRLFEFAFLLCYALSLSFDCNESGYETYLSNPDYVRKGGYSERVKQY